MKSDRTSLKFKFENKGLVQANKPSLKSEAGQKSQEDRTAEDPQNRTSELDPQERAGKIDSAEVEHGARKTLRWGGPHRWGGPRRRGRLRLQLPLAAAGLAALAVLLPALLVHRGGFGTPQSTPPAGQQAPAGQTPSAAEVLEDGPKVSVYLTDTGAVETLPLEQYVLGVLAAEMPSKFDIEALKAQAMAARTFIVKRLAEGDRSGVPDKAADVTDTVTHQAYLSKAELAAWKKKGEGAALQKLQNAVIQTAGQIITYKGKPISALFFSASGGYTENSEDYWSNKIPYLRSVASPWDAQIDPSYKETVQIPLQEVYSKLGLAEPSLTALAQTGTSKSQNAAANLFTVIDRTQGDSIKEIKIGGKLFTGREVREKLGLRSSRFDVRVEKNEAVITTYGYGHGVGMSQWGANGMAQEGYTAKQILQHYYTGIAFESSSKFLR